MDYTGQLLFIALASLAYTVFIFFVSVLVLIPNVQLSAEWGIIIKTLALKPDMAPSSVTIFMSEQIITMFSAVEATLISFGFFWLVSIFIGVLIFCFNIVIGKASGLVATGVFIFISYFSVYLGMFSFGMGIYYLSPLSWMSLAYLDWNYTGTFPSPIYAVLVLIGTILLMGIVSVSVFCKKDMNIQEWG